ncbi:hypothetical protein [Leisingera caerulea]|uniref:Uncharacterized protein n=1 Tax=Leisingera caerulea TaxID=506591 RepID=A0A9Q9HKX3_LEICA|nr:hypothetical protein [Leisingera caerulea]UWQ55997.1 hypothetical protein K3721_18760 [Leisingera caerulea]
MNLVFMLRALAARRSAALPNFFLCMAEENAAITASRGKFETSNSRVARHRSHSQAPCEVPVCAVLRSVHLLNAAQNGEAVQPTRLIVGNVAQVQTGNKDGNLRLHPMIAKLVDADALKEMGVAQQRATVAEDTPQNN